MGKMKAAAFLYRCLQHGGRTNTRLVGTVRVRIRPPLSARFGETPPITLWLRSNHIESIEKLVCLADDVGVRHQSMSGMVGRSSGVLRSS